MKVLYLIPKHHYEVMNNGSSHVKGNIVDADDTIMTNMRNEDKVPKSEEKWVTRMLPPPIQNTIALKAVKTPDKIMKNPSLYDHLSLKVGTHEIGRARLILKHIEKSDKILWNDEGDIYVPINNYNIIDIIHDFIYQRDIKDPKKLDDYKYFITVANLPVHLIKNKHVLDFLTRDSGLMTSVKKSPKKKRGAGIFKKKKKVHMLSKWKVY